MELDSIREKANQEFSMCKAEFQQQLLKDNELRENELKEILKKQKESEISLLMERLQADVDKTKVEIEKISEAKIKYVIEFLNLFFLFGLVLARGKTHLTKLKLGY